MSMAVTDATEASSSAVADDWETGEVQQEEQLKNKQQQIRILKREKENREAAQREQLSFPVGFTPAPVAAPADAKPIPVAPRKLLRRPASGPNMATAAATASVVDTPVPAAPTATPADVSPTIEPRVEDGETGAEVPVEEEEKFKNLEKRKTAYDAARSRILGSDYKPEEVKAPVNTSCRSRSPEVELKQRMAMSGGGGGGGVSHGGPPPVSLTMMPQVNYSEPPPPIPPAHMMAYMLAAQQQQQQQQQQTFYPQQSAYAPMGLGQMGSTSNAASSTSSAQQGYRDIFDTSPMFSVPPPTTTSSIIGQMRPQPLATMSLLSSALPPPPSTNGINYSMPPPSMGVYGRPPPSIFQSQDPFSDPAFQNPDITFRHETARGGRRRKN